MRYIKLAILSVFVFALLITGISLFFPSHIRISKAVNIKTTPDAVWKQVDDIRNWPAWNPLMQGAAGKKTTYTDTSGGHWKQIQIEGTTISILNPVNGEHQASMQSGSRRAVINGWACFGDPANTSTPGADSLTVQWYMDFHLHWYPWEKFSSLMLEKNYGPAMEEGLTRLKQLLQQ
ncbi:MAG: SRPBCC family protein [Chitinophagaceae bacterium]|nr:SRPBCC family protein [Chitinophagaceae bacterium]MBL0334901.1 SRPBCC family protein [Chitinophagaceae bacterium]